jgi:myo-inositol-1-phosphate synthase
VSLTSLGGQRTRRRRVNVAIVGVGNCASSLVQGIAYYSQSPDAPGLIHRAIAGYTAESLRVVVAFDVNTSKIGKPIHEAIFAEPNCTAVFANRVPFSGAVLPGPVLDGVSPRTADSMKPHRINKSSAAWRRWVVRHLRDKNVDVLVSYLPVGSRRATTFYAQCALEAKVAFANAIPEFICSTPTWSQKFKHAGVPCAGDDIKSQLGATILHRVIVDLIHRRGLTIDSTYQLNVGGNTDFLNMLDEERMSSKRVSKTEAVTSMVPDYALQTRIGPSDYIPHLRDNKIAYVEIRGHQFGGVPFSLDLKLSVEDSPNSAGAMLDVIRLLRVARDRGLSGYQDFGAYYFKHPAIQIREDVARQVVDDFIADQ